MALLEFLEKQTVRVEDVHAGRIQIQLQADRAFLLLLVQRDDQHHILAGRAMHRKEHYHRLE